MRKNVLKVKIPSKVLEIICHPVGIRVVRESLFKDAGDDETAKEYDTATKDVLSVCMVWVVLLNYFVACVTKQR